MVIRVLRRFKPSVLARGGQEVLYNVVGDVVLASAGAVVILSAPVLVALGLLVAAATLWLLGRARRPTAVLGTSPDGRPVTGRRFVVPSRRARRGCYYASVAVAVVGACWLAGVAVLEGIEEATKTDAMRQDVALSRQTLASIEQRMVTKEFVHATLSKRTTSIDDSVEETIASLEDEPVRLLAYLDDQIAARSDSAVDLHRIRARTAMEIGDLDRTEESVRRIVAIEPFDVEAMVLLGLVLLDQGDLDEALEEIGLAIASFDDDTEPHVSTLACMVRARIRIASGDDLAQVVMELDRVGKALVARGHVEDAWLLHVIVGAGLYQNEIDDRPAGPRRAALDEAALAQFERALTVKGIDDGHRALTRLVLASMRYRFPEEALRHARAAVALAQEANDPSLIGACHRVLAEALIDAGQVPEAERHARTALAILESGDDPVDEASARVTLANVLVEQERYDEALAALLLAIRIDDPHHVADTYFWIFELHRARQDRTAWRRAIDRATPIFAEVGRQLELIGELESLALDYEQSGDVTAAAEIYDEAISRYMKYGNTESAAWTYQSKRHMFEMGDDMAGEYRAIGDALPFYRALGEAASVAGDFSALATRAERRGDHELARKARRAAVAIDLELGHDGDAARELQWGWSAALAQGNLDEAGRFLIDAIPVYRRLGDSIRIAAELADLAGRHEAAGGLDAAAMILATAGTLWSELDEPYGAAYMHYELGWVRLQQDRRPDARHHWEQAITLFTEAGADEDVQGVRDTIEQELGTSESDP